MAEISLFLKGASTNAARNTILAFDAVSSAGQAVSESISIHWSELTGAEAINERLAREARTRLNAEESDRVTIYGGAVWQG